MQDLKAVEARRVELQSQLDERKSPSERNRWGQFATPPALAWEIMRYVSKLWEGQSGAIRFLEPALGTGAFYSALRQVFPNSRIEIATGVELDPHVSRIAQSLWGERGLRVTTADFTALDPQRQYNLIVTNPPYVRHHHLDLEYKQRLQALITQRFGYRMSGLAGLYCYFLLLADAWMVPGGIGVWLIPAEFMDVNYGIALKRYLSKQVTLLRLHRFAPDDVQFDQALVSSSVVVFQKQKPLPTSQAEFSLGGSLLEPDRTASFTAGQLLSIRKWTSLVGNSRANVKAHPDIPVLGDLFEIKRGIATGANRFFILPRREAQRLGIPEMCLRPILPSPRYLKQSVIEPDPDGYPQVDPQLALIDCSLPEQQIQEQYPDFWAYLQKGIEQSIYKRYIPSRRTPWYCQEQRRPAPFLCTYMGRGQNQEAPFRFIWNQSQAIAANVYLMLYPRKALAKALNRDHCLCSQVFRFFQSLDSRCLVREGRVYGGGLHKIEPKELARLPVMELEDVLQAVAQPRQLLLLEEPSEYRT